MKRLGVNLPQRQLVAFRDSIDANGDGEISLMEFKEAVKKRRLEYRERLVKESWAVFLDFLATDHGVAESIEGLFSMADADGNGSLDIAELAEALENFGLKMEGEQLDAFREDMDTNNDHCITLTEFLVAVDKRSQELAGGSDD